MLDGNEFGNLNIEGLTQFEQRQGIRLPEDYKAFLLEHNGGVPQPNSIDFVENGKTTASDVHYLYGIHAGPDWSQLEVSIKAFCDRIPPGFIPIGADSGGNEYLLGIQSVYLNQVYFWDHELEVAEGQEPDLSNMSFVSESFGEFLASLHE